MKIQNKIFLGGGGRGVGVGGGGGGQSGCERRIEDFVKIQKKNLGGGSVGGSLFPIEKPMFPNLTFA